ncbi:betaine-aldehyde dehydrogenase [Oceanicella actignis]|uniref:Betaine aldehyde dehydrogenase n=1 Tax=Oceanicella actignis TaxID=1189325 RepID=A0A1M7SWS3_9RHOB|nr:betaine-aldehyde dehydrogenase [Oceanicella actignis]SES74058.1 betaine aldehyde dehydrogenase [Oceanicella actignis]SHN62856.1 betaine-aldehyde dehydrogenase [Oceanicella actignis]
MRAQPEASHFIDGAFVEDAAGAPIDVFHPATGEVIARVHSATPAVIDRALESARAAQAVWAATAPAERGRVLRRAADIIRARNRELSELETLDTGKPLQETLVADATSGADALEYFGGLADAITGEYIPLGGPGDDFVYTIREPLGVCVGIGAWNYPTQIACWKAAPALACGNAMVFKPSETTPLCALEVARIMIEAGAPPGLFNVVQGLGDVGAALATDPRVDKVSLTGSVPTGAKVYSAAAAQLKHVTMELGGKSPLIIFDDADLEDAVGGAMLGNFYSTGQVCSNGTRVYVHRAIKERFLARLAERTAAIRIGDPLDEATQMGPVVSAAQHAKVLSYIELGKREGARLVCGGQALPGPGWWVQPTVFADVTDDMRIAREEIFGPVMCVLDFEDEEDVIARANDTEFGLSAGVFTRDLKRGHRVIARIRAGACWINAYNLAPVEAPFGGMRKSGVGRENSRAALDHYSQIKSVYVGMKPVDSPY